MFKANKNARTTSMTYFTSFTSVSVIKFVRVNVSFEYKNSQFSAGIKLEKKFW